MHLMQLTTPSVRLIQVLLYTMVAKLGMYTMVPIIYPGPRDAPFGAWFLENLNLGARKFGILSYTVTLICDLGVLKLDQTGLGAVYKWLYNTLYGTARL